MVSYFDPNGMHEVSEHLTDVNPAGVAGLNETAVIAGAAVVDAWPEVDLPFPDVLVFDCV